MRAALKKTHGSSVISNAEYEDAKNRYLKGESAEVIARELHCRRGTLDARFSRDGLTKIKRDRLHGNSGDRTKLKFSEIVENIADKLISKTPKTAEGLNLHADTAQKAFKIGSGIYGWEQTTINALFMPGSTSHLVDPAIIDVPVEVEPST